MFFYIDESGNTGLNLKDKSQPHLYYGVLSSPLNLEQIEIPEIKEIKDSLSVSRLHANELGIARLSKTSDNFIRLIKKYRLRFDLHLLKKSDYIIISFFDQIFDQGLNPAVPWSWYWTPLRYPLLFNIASLFDDELLYKAWEARIDNNQDKSNNILIYICNTLLERVNTFYDLRLKEIVSNALVWAINNVNKLYYNGFGDKNSQLQISPNLVGFQSVLFGILHRSKEQSDKVDKIVVDQQSQFNNAQKWLAELYQRTNDMLYIGPGLPEMDLRNMFKTPIECISGDSSIGLEIVDVFLWLFKRKIENKNISIELDRVCDLLCCEGLYDEISLDALSKRWEKWFNSLPELSEYTESHLEKIKKKRDEESQKIEDLISAYR